MTRNRLRASLRKKLRTFPQFTHAQKDKEYLKQSRLFLERNFSGYKNTDWHFYYSTLNGIKSLQYIPDDLYFTQIEPTLNEYSLVDAYSDKISFDHFFDKAELPETVYKLVRNRFFDDENNLVSYDKALIRLLQFGEKLVLKPALLNGGGVGVVVEFGQKISELISGDKKYSQGSYIIQKFVKQHPQLAKYHPNSLNTCRIMTARVGSDFVVLSAYLRFGINDSKIDNAQSGGIMCRIDNDGNISDYAMDIKGTHFSIHPDTGIAFKGGTIPNYDKVITFCKSGHKKLLRFSIISWDIGVNEEGYPIFIEYNLSRQSINAHQVFNGPLFGEHTEELLEYYNESKKRNLFHI